MKASIVIPTLRRPDDLQRVLNSLCRLQTLVAVEAVIVVDNDPAQSARSCVSQFQQNAPWPIQWVHCPEPGIANARNAGVSAARNANLIAFIDDDETATPQWLDALIATQAAHNADVVFGPIEGVAPSSIPKHKDAIEAFFSRSGPATSGIIDRSYGCGNSLMVRASTLADDTPFDASSNDRGGEDDILFARLKQQNCRFAWAHEALVHEIAPPHRANATYLLKRAFAFGQGPSQTAREQKQWLALGRWMLIGSLQFAIYAPAALCMHAFGRPNVLVTARRAAEGLGKLLWFDVFEPRFYGQAELQRLDKNSSGLAEED